MWPINQSEKKSNMEEFGIIMDQLSKHGYQYIRTIGFGNFSQVYLCKSLKYNILFALKRIINSKVTDSEYNALISLNHHYIVQLYEIIKEEDCTYLVMDYCPNNTLMQKGKLSYNEFIHYARQILEALSYCHSKLIAHRDIKPDNIFIDQYDRIKLADFGFAKQFDHETISTERCGSIMYCSPEIVKGQSSFDPFQADIYALGITFYYMITGKFPFISSSLENLKKSIIYGQIDFSDYDVNSEIKNLIMKMTARNPKMRPAVDSLLNFNIFNQPQKTVSFYSHFSKSQYRFFTNTHHINKSMSFSSGSEMQNEPIPLKKRKPAINQCKSIIVTPNVPINSFHSTFNH